MKLLTFSSSNAWEAPYPEGVSLWFTSAFLGLHDDFEVKEFEEPYLIYLGVKESS